MSDDLLRNLPQSPRLADDTNVVQLPSADLSQLFRASLPKHPNLSPQQAHMAALMHRAGRDAGAIAERTEASLGTVLDFLDRLRKAEAKKAAAAVESAPERHDSVPAASADIPAEHPGAPAAAPRDPKPAPAPQRDTRPDVELTALQLSLIRRLRKTRVSADTIARMMRLSADQVLRIAGEIP